jgi:hypothetical protein
MLGPSVMGALARAQLAAWEAIARDWPTYADDPMRRCVSCHVGIWREVDEHGISYQWTPEQTLAATVLHLRHRHADLDPDR